jgi:RNA polymerase sigma-70 factor (ECF subfamily)
MDWLDETVAHPNGPHGPHSDLGPTQAMQQITGDIDAAWDRMRSADIHRLFVEHHKSLLAFISRRMASADEAHDVVQIAFVEAFRCYDRFSGASSMKTWLFGIALNVMRNHRLRSPWRHISPLDDETLAAIGEQAPSPQEIHEARSTVERVLRRLEDVSPEHRETLLLVVIDGLSYESAAERLGVAVGTVRSRVSRLRSVLRDSCVES